MKTNTNTFRWQCAICLIVKSKTPSATAQDAARDALLTHPQHRSGLYVTNGKTYIGQAVGINFHNSKS